MKTKLFSPGPVLVTEEVRNSLTHYDICHRSPEFEEMFQQLQENILKIFEADDSYYAVVVSGSGTSANETCLSSIFNEGDEALLINNGEFGGRLKEILEKHGVPFTEIAPGWANEPDMAEVEAALKANDKIKFVCMVYHETSTAMINPVHEVGTLAHKYGRRFFIDCVSAAAGQHIKVVDNCIDICTSVGGKCVGAYPGSAYVCAKKDLLDSLTPEMGKTVYLNLAKHYQMAVSKHQTPNTPNVNLFWPLNVALKAIVAEGLDNYIERHAHYSKICREACKELGLKMLLPEEKMSNTVTSVFLPAGKDVNKFIEDMGNDGYTVYAGKGKYLEMNMFQFATMGNITDEDCKGFIEALKKNVQ